MLSKCQLQGKVKFTVWFQRRWTARESLRQDQPIWGSAVHSMPKIRSKRNIHILSWTLVETSSQVRVFNFSEEHAGSISRVNCCFNQ